MTRKPRPAASRAMPAPLMPPPMTSRSKAAFLCSLTRPPQRPPRQPESRLRIGNDTVADPGECVVQAHGERLEVLAHVELRADVAQTSRAIEKDRLVRVPDRRGQ